MSSIDFITPEHLKKSSPEAAGGKIDLSAIREKLSGQGGPAYWRSLEEVADTEEFQSFLKAEFPAKAEEFDPVNRREFMKLMGASMALAGLTACTVQPPEKIIPFVNQPENLVPGKPIFYASAIPLRGYGRGILVESHMGRPTKIEGNELHPDSLGSTDATTQAAVLNLYDPDRSTTVMKNGRISAYEIFSAQFDKKVAALPPDGEGLSILVGAISSPSLGAMIKEVIAKYPKARLVQYEPADNTFQAEGLELAYGSKVSPVFDFNKADVILSLDADFLANGPGGLRYARDFSDKRNAADGSKHPSRFYALESSPTVTGVAADHRLPIRRADMSSFALALAKKVGASVSGPEVHLDAASEKYLAAVAEDLKHHKGSGLVIAGDGMPADVHAAVAAINEALGNRGKTVKYIPTLNPLADSVNTSISELAAELNAGNVKLLAIYDANPVYNAPADAGFEAAIQGAETRVHFGQYFDETARYCNWHVPTTHFLEAWGDTVAYDGTASIVQPLIAPLYANCRDPYTLFGKLAGNPTPSYDFIRSFWTSELGEDGFEAKWQQSVHDGLIEGTARRGVSVSLKSGIQVAPVPASEEYTYEILFNPDPTVGNGRDANNGWLQELPKPITKITWDNAALISPHDAEEFHTHFDKWTGEGDVVEITVNGLSVKAPVFIQPGQAKGSVTLNLGYGRTHAGSAGSGIGFSAYAVRTSDTPWTAQGASVLATGESFRIATTQHHHSMEGRELVRTGTFDEYEKHPHFVHAKAHGDLSKNTLYPGHDYSDRNKWGMVINLNNCIGCNACITACQAENNIAIVGKKEVAKGRELHWLRVDRYYKGPLDNPETVTQPVPCMQCENAPCEVVCPVGATVHSAEGLNDMVYNRCVGTRYCSNNCPYKVRRFNFFGYTDQRESIKLQRNPDVTVRYRGVMEKCTYCVQRINFARVDASKENRPVRDGEVLTACQQACPTRAITFGNLNDEESQVARLRNSNLNYTLLDELITRPRTSYLAKLTNPNPSLASETTGKAEAHHGH